ncbi:MAG: T9SS type A sorting domain-containing protein [Paludibacteraceae bacterium]|nr:T9SS type A sorting domain-containing protein [Paludibacteraceae bacterium]
MYGHEGISGDNSSLNLSAYKIEQFEKYEYVDSVYTNGINDKEGFTKVSYVDSIGYIQKQVFTKRYTAQMEVTQVTGADKPLPYFGDTVAYSDNMLGETEKIQLWNESNGYSLKYPVFSTGSNYRFKYEVFEEYPFYISSKKDIDSSKIDRVMAEPTEVLFNNKMAISDSVDTENSIYMFKVTEPSISSATGTIAATFTYGTSDNPTSVAWENPIGNSNGMAYILGAHQTGTNFVTAGPDKLLCVLRDPPGSNSYSYLEKGVTFSEESKYTGSVKNEGNEDFTTGVEVRTQQITVVGVGTMVGTATTLAEVESGVTLGISHSEEYTGNNSSKTSVTTTTRFQTSDDPLYVGANGDLYIGYSTNITFGTSQNVKAVSRATYDSLGGESAYEKTYLVNDNIAVVQSNGVTMGQKFGTLFAYPQVHIEQVLIPTLEELRNSLLLLPSEADSSTLQAKANADSVNYYYSLVNADDVNFGKPNYYVPYLSQSLEYARDTIEALNTYIKDWKKALSDNDSVKATVIKDEKLKLQNYSFQAGGNVEYSEQYSSTLTSNHSFSITIGGKVSNDTYLGTTGAKTKFEFEETVETSQGGEFENELEASHAKGFVLAEDGDDDYLSVDVFHDSEKTDETYEQNGVNSGSVDKNSLKKKDSYSTFVFCTKGGATGCPYEGAYTASHWKGHETEVISAATMKLENPKIDMPTKFVENVPSGEDAYLTVYLKNDSETGEDQWFDLRFVDATNPYGAVPSIDGNSMSGFALEYLVPAGQVLEKTLTVTKGSVLNYDNMAIALCSKCQADPTDFLDVISDTVYFSVHFIPSCSNVTIAKPSNNWTYNTNCSVDTIDGVAKHYMPITISGFDVNYTDFEHIELQYKPASGSDNDWLTLAYYYKEDSLAKNAVANGLNASAISSTDGGNIYYNFYMDNLPDQKYDLRAVSFCNINNELYDNPSEVVSGIKDMYNPRLFGTPKPADGVLTINDDIRIDFNETIAEGMLTANNFEVTGVRNGAVSDHSVAIALDGVNDYLVTEATRNFAKKDLTFECWVNFDSLQNATFFSHGSANEAISMGMNNNGNVVVKVGSKEIPSERVPAWEKSSWNHVALVYDNVDTTVTAYVNYVSVIDGQKVGAYNGNGVVEIGRNVATQSGNFNGKVDQFRIWNAVRSSATIQANSATQLSGNDLGLIAYYAMDEAKGNATEDKARGANLIMKGGSWALPEGRSAAFDGTDYVALNSSAAVIPSDMDFTLEFWFNAENGAKNQTIISNGNGIDNVGEDPAKLFSVGFNENGVLSFNHNGYSTLVDGDYADNNWHNFTLSVSRSSGTARIYMDGQLNTYFSNDKVDRIASDKLYAGARVWHKEKSVTKTVDQYFTGKVDEIRLWNLYRQQSQIESFYNQKSNGDEMGLLLYYPFEHYIDWQGTKEMQFTLNNIVNNDTTSVAVGKVNGVTNIPPIKSKGAVSSLLYDWVVNNDALIITLKEQDYRIEKTIVNVTVNKVQDVNGNYILSPITLSAYIDRNQLKWMDDAVTIEKKEGESYKFEMPIVNNGGSVINYRLNNMPSWLSASSESGVIKPLEKQTVKFEIDPSLAVGSYNEVVYLTNSNNVTEPLALNVTVEGSTPEWNVAPSKYEFSMAVFAQIKVDGQFSNDEKDMLAAFYQGECVGKANISYDKTLDMWYALMTVYSPVSRSHNVEYRIWDASKGLMSRAAASVSANFVNNSVLGKPDQPIVFSNDSLKYQNIQLNKGWNWVSFNLKNENMSDMDAYLANGNWAANSFVKNKNKSANYSSSLKTWVNEGVSLNNTSMFKIYSEYDQTLFVSGSDIDLASTELTVNGKSWNYISYLPAYSMSVKEALTDYEATEGDVIKSNDGFAMYYGNNWIGSLKNMLPNSGYMLKNAGATKTFKYPTASSSLRSATAIEATASDYEMNMNIIAYVPEKQDGDVVRAIVGNVENEVVEVELTDDYALQFINIAANAGDNIRFALEHDGVTYVASNQLSFVGDEVCGSPKSPVILTFNVDGVGDALTVYPNPVDDELNIKGVVDNNEDVSIEIFDLTGKLVYSSTVTVSDYTLEALVNMTDFTSGSYMLKVTQNGESNTFKIVKK